jgi:MFS family permease
VGDVGCLRLGLVAEAVGLATLTLVHTRPELVVPLALVTAGQGLCTPALNAVVVARAGDAERGSALGAQQGCSALARVVGPALGGLAYGAFGPGAAFVGGGIVVAGALAVALVMRGPGGSHPQKLVEPSAHRLPLGNNG